MLYPSIDALKEKIDSKYSLVSLASKRARQMQEEGNEKLSRYVSYKPVGKALEEVASGALTKEKQDESTVYEDEI
ncbi:DNA-directed RNA polymerase subunit omega [Ureibacillus composti]|uniref:DNA-directed RNA polymerase subunit omega n=1 Tax=Lysinibacillus composti TaxID=720633 RepID=A0A3N9UFV8_9BACI|nr:DNA-directed RNA polymerase subunit omega [Lysinibacillus composti]MBM7608302.1 DNA-directed RNA polymerase subunit omega [Lysinibacillus composti]MDM5332670.1 DNA-directed RNA polymerase subunit omega [Ureibacillus composti]RQW75017.1 DNA-directed RNA polymerase subunit omega [Lysinibacillus composti]